MPHAFGYAAYFYQNLPYCVCGNNLLYAQQSGKQFYCGKICCKIYYCSKQFTVLVFRPYAGNRYVWHTKPSCVDFVQLQLLACSKPASPQPVPFYKGTETSENSPQYNKNRYKGNIKYIVILSEAKNLFV